MTDIKREDTYLADIMCKRQGKKKGIPTPEGYWNLPDWKLEYRTQILAANRLLKIYPFDVVLAAVNNKKMSWVYSLHYPGLKQVLTEELGRYERKLKREENIKEKLVNREETIQSNTAPLILEDNRETLRNKLD